MSDPADLPTTVLASEDAQTLVVAAPVPTRSNTEQCGDFIGRYRLITELGEGGFGIVWRAEQFEPIRREVALKVIKPGMDSREIIARFEVERQTLALMEHPNIAGVLDAGTTENGRPYFVMELVKGVPITDYCDAKRLTIQHRLELFIPVCQAVQHAHQKAILHRDLKPSNILVTEVDGKPVPKVIDFGIAKALGTSPEAALKASLLQTQAGAVIGTPQYMSPEQAGAEQDLDTRSDIYTLGVILFELLTGDTPLSRASLHKAALDEVLRQVREAEPRRPSSRIQPASAVDTHTSDARHTEPARLTRSLRGDLDWITLKALEKDRGRRYESAAALAQDLERHLRDEPVEAGPPSMRYRLNKMVRKHKRAFAAAAAIVLCLVTGLVVSAYALLRERQALAELRSTAPTFHSVAQSKLDEGRFGDALEKIGYAIQLDGDKPEYRLFRANLLQALQRLTEARDEYQRVLALRPDEEAIRTNLALCEQLLAESGGEKELPKTLQRRLFEALIAQGRLVEAGPLSALFEPDVTLAEATIRARLNEYKKQVPWKENRVTRLPDGTFKVNLSRLTLKDLSVLQGLPISVLDLAQDYFNKNRLADLSGIRGLPLRELYISDSNVADLGPLRGMPLEKLDISRTPVLDLSPLSGMKLRRLVMSYPRIYGRVSDLKPLKGMPLEHLDLENATNVVDISPLRGAPLTYLRLTQTRVADLSPLAGSPLVDLQVAGTDISDLTPLASCIKLETLNIYGTKVTDLSPIAKLHLTHFDCHWNTVTSLEPLRGQPLSYINFSRIPASSSAAPIQGNPFKFINLAGHPGIDLSPLAYCVTLEEIVLPSQVKNMEVLRSLPRLLVITDVDGTRTAEQFWKVYDGKQQTEATLREKLREYQQQPGWNNSRVNRNVATGSQSDNQFSVNLGGLKIDDLSILRGLPVSSLVLASADIPDLSSLPDCPLDTLDISFTAIRDLLPLKKLRTLRTLLLSGTAVKDFAPLAGLQLNVLHASNTPVTSVKPLAGLPLRFVFLDGTQVIDLGPLMNCTALEEIILPPKAEQVELLRKLPALKFISYRGNGARPAQTAVEFWKEFDAKKGTVR